MPTQPTYPGLYVEEVPSTTRTITPAPTSITAFVGYAHPFLGIAPKNVNAFGPVDIFNFGEFERYFGPLFRSSFLDSNLAYAVTTFFLNGGSHARVVGLRPRYHGGGAPPEEITGATGTLSGITFTARQLTDADQPVTITIRNLRSGTGTDDVADMMITFGTQVETYRGVTTRQGDPAQLSDPDHASFLADYVGTRLANSNLVQVAPTTGGQYAASFGAAAALDLDTMPAPTIANPTTFSAADFTALFQDDSALDKAEIVNLVCVPGIADNAVRTEVLAYCERNLAFYVMDPPPNSAADASGGLEAIETHAQNNLPVSPNGALYFPYLRYPDTVSGSDIELPPSGYVAGAFARSDRARGVWKAPAGLETTLSKTNGVVDRGRMTDMRHGILNPLGVNVLRPFPGSGTVVWGARTTATRNPAFQQWRYVPVRRMALFIEQSLLRNLGWVVFEPNDEPLWSAIRLSIEDFMLSLYRQQAFQGASPNEAFEVRCDATTTTQTDIDLGIVNIQVGFRPLKPAEFVIIKIAQLAGQAGA